MLENIRRIGIFMIAAQTVIHFAAGKQYEKYMKIIAGVIILVQFISPFVSSADEMVVKWQEQARQMAEQIERRDEVWRRTQYTVRSAEQTAIREIENEIKSRFNEMISDTDDRVTNVSVRLEEDETGGAWIFRSVRVTMDFAEGNGSGQTQDMQVWDGDARIGAGAYDRIWDGDMEEEGARTGGSFPEEKQKEEAQRKEAQKERIRIEEIRIGDTEGGAEEGMSREQGFVSDPQKQKYRELFARALGVEEEKVEVIWFGGW